MNPSNPARLTLLAELSGHTEPVWCCAWSPNGKALATSSGDKHIRIWTREGSDHSWVCRQVLEGVHNRAIRSVAWSPNGKLLASASFDGTVAIWQNEDGEFECIATLEGHENEVKCVSWSASGALLATCSRDKSVWIWGADPDQDYECISVLHGHTQDVKFVRWHPLEELLISCSYDNSLKVWSEEDDDWYCTETMSEHSSTVWGMDFEPGQGQRMVSCSDDKSLVIWQRSPAADPKVQRHHWKKVGVLAAHHSRTVFSVSWSSEGCIASGAADDAIRVFVEEKETEFTLAVAQPRAHTADVNCVAWNPVEPRLLASAGDDGLVKIWRYESGVLQRVDEITATAVQMEKESKERREERKQAMPVATQGNASSTQDHHHDDHHQPEHRHGPGCNHSH